MKSEDMILVSVDDHICEPAGMFEGRLPRKWQDRAPKTVTKTDGTDVWVFEGRQIPNLAVNAVAGRPPEEYGMEPTSFSQLRPGCYDIDARVGDMNAAGILGSLCFPSFPGLCGDLFTQQDDKELAHVMLQAYNDWHIDDWCGTQPGRFIPLALPAMWDPELLAQEVRRVAKKGCHAFTFSDNPQHQGLPSLHDPHWDPFWKACCDEGTVVCMHIGSGTGMSFDEPDCAAEILIASVPISLFHTAMNLVFSPALRKFPTLKIALSEGGIGWMPYFLERADYTYQHHRHWTHQDLGGKLPSDIFREHIICCFIDDPAGVEARHRIGIDTLTWECDYPHSDSTWPNAPEELWKALDGVPDNEIDKITHLNAMRHFQYDPFAHRKREACTVGSLRAEAKDVDLSVRRGGGGKPPSAYDKGYVTVGDLLTQISTAFAVPFAEDGQE
jgi:predicted TIM-barrel fold metal-dependent hydrolase